MHSWTEFVDCTKESKYEWQALTHYKCDTKLPSLLVGTQFRDAIPFADYIEHLGWKKNPASAD